MRSVILGLLLLLLPAALSWAGNTHQTPTGVDEWQAWHSDALAPFIVSGCLPATSGSTTVAAIACTGYVRGSATTVVYVTQGAQAIGPLTGGDGTFWVALHRDTSTAASGWTRQAGTHYLWRRSSSLPSTPTGAMIVAKLTVAGSAVTAVSDLRPLDAQGALPAHKFAGDDLAAKINAALTACPSHGCVVDARQLTGAQGLGTDMFSGITRAATVLLGPGTMTVSAAQTLPTGAQVIGAGPGETTLQLLSGIASSTKLFKNADQTNGNSRVLLSSMTLDGNRAANSATAGLTAIEWQKVTSSRITNLRMTGFTQHCIDQTTNNRENLIDGNWCDDYGTTTVGICIMMLNSSDRNRVIGNRCTSTRSNVGIFIDDQSGGTGGTASTENVVMGNVIEGAAASIQVQGSSRNTITGNTMYRPLGSMCLLMIDAADSGNITASNVVADNVCEIEAGVNAWGMLIEGASHSITGNTILRGQYGIYVRDNVDLSSFRTTSLLIANNTISSTALHGIYVAGGRQLTLEGNVITSPGASGILVAPDVANAAMHTLRIAGGQIVQPQHHGVYLQSSASLTMTDVQVEGVFVSGPGQAAATTYSGVALQAGAAALARVSVADVRVTQVGANAPRCVHNVESGAPTLLDFSNNRNWGWTETAGCTHKAIFPTRLIECSASLNYGATAANTCDQLTISCTGAADGDHVQVATPSALVSGGNEFLVGHVSGADTVAVRRCNVSAAPLSDPAATSVTVRVVKY